MTRAGMNAHEGGRWLLWMLAAVFLWSVVKDIHLMLTYEQSAGLQVFGAYGLMTLFFAFAAATFLLDVAALFCVWRRTPEGFWVCVAAVLANLAYDVVSMGLALGKRSGWREAHVTVREMLGLPAQPENAVRVIAVVLVLGVLYRIVVIAALVRARHNFHDSHAEADAQPR